MKIKLSATFEGKCNICGKEEVVFTAGDEDSKKAVTVCKGCSDKLGEMQLSEAIEKYGKVDEKAFENGVKVDKKGKAG
jgi:transcription elongation factor Elf1